MIELNGHVIAMAVSHEENELFVNVRSWPDGAVPTMENTPAIAQQIETVVIDLNTLERTSKVLFYPCSHIHWLLMRAQILFRHFSATWVTLLRKMVRQV